MKYLLDLLQFIQPFGSQSYWVIMAVLLACGFGLPLPEDITLVTAGILASRGIIDFNYTVALCMTGVLLGDFIIFYLGGHFGTRLRTTKFFKLVLPASRDEAVKAIFEKYGDKVIFMARFMPGLRTPLFFASGTYHVPVWKFFLLDGSAALISVPTWIYIGYLFGANLETLENVIRHAQFGMYVGLACIVAFLVGGYFLKKRLLRVR
jgi:membrane protein DedA with SNARE-associated domain